MTQEDVRLASELVAWSLAVVAELYAPVATRALRLVLDMNGRTIM